MFLSASPPKHDEQVVVLLFGTVGRRDAAAERTGMYLQRVPDNKTTTCDLMIDMNICSENEFCLNRR